VAMFWHATAATTLASSGLSHSPRLPSVLAGCDVRRDPWGLGRASAPWARSYRVAVK